MNVIWFSDENMADSRKSPLLLGIAGLKHKEVKFVDGY